MRGLPQLKALREQQALSLRALANLSGVSHVAISQIERGERQARPTTLRKLADALGVEAEELTKKGKARDMEQKTRMEKVEVEVRWETDHGIHEETLRFRGEEIDSYERGASHFSLYKCPGGYRVHVQNGDDGTAYLNPASFDRVGYPQYPTYSVEELLRKFPEFGEVFGVHRVRDID